MQAPAVLHFRRLVQASDGVFISTPEYAHGIPGVLKNALDWLVGTSDLVDKPVALLNASSRSTYAQASLVETLKVMSARLVPDACVTIPLLGKNVEPVEILADPEMSRLLISAITALIAGIRGAATPNHAVADPVKKYVDATEQLVTEIVVRDIRRSVEFYRTLGFQMLRDAGDFVELTWEEHRLFMAAQSAFEGVNEIHLAPIPSFPLANVRVMVEHVDHYWKIANEIGAKIIVPVGNRYYGLRDFTIADPDGFGVRFASLL
jgi:catechol 2,3-dioxygenase-like lactoylglutathione lyase family enzyme